MTTLNILKPSLTALRPSPNRCTECGAHADSDTLCFRCYQSAPCSTCGTGGAHVPMAGGRKVCAECFHTETQAPGSGFSSPVAESESDEEALPACLSCGEVALFHLHDSRGGKHPCCSFCTAEVMHILDSREEILEAAAASRPTSHSDQQLMDQRREFEDAIHISAGPSLHPPDGLRW